VKRRVVTSRLPYFPYLYAYHTGNRLAAQSIAFIINQILGFNECGLTKKLPNLKANVEK